MSAEKLIITYGYNDKLLFNYYIDLLTFCLYNAVLKFITNEYDLVIFFPFVYIKKNNNVINGNKWKSNWSNGKTQRFVVIL